MVSAAGRAGVAVGVTHAKLGGRLREDAGRAEGGLATEKPITINASVTLH